MPAATVSPDPGRFGRELSTRLRRHFEETGTGPGADALMRAKLVLGFAAFALTYAAMGVFDLSPAGFLLVYLAHGATHLFLLLNVGHDANHGAISRSARVNDLFSFAMDLCGVNSRMWRVAHHKAHHYCTNLHPFDEAIDGRGLLRLSPEAPWRPAHRWQHLYAPALYALISLDYVLVRDFEYYLRPNKDVLRAAERPRRAWAFLFASKAAYLVAMIAVPAWVFGYGGWPTLVAFLLAHLIVGLGAAVVFQTTHALPDNRFPAAPEEIDDHVLHTFATTVDCAPESRLHNLWTGGLNAHVIHHLHPRICHTHYPALSRIVRETAEDCGIPYRSHPGFGPALAAHWRLLRRLGAGPGAPESATPRAAPA